MSNKYQYPIPNKTYDIHERIFQFIIRVLNFLKTLPSGYTNQIIKNQITRSVTSMGANDQEADGALTPKDFIYGFTVVRKEGKETVYWLKVIRATNNLDSQKTKELEYLFTEGSEIVAVISTIIKNSSNTLRIKFKKT